MARLPGYVIPGQASGRAGGTLSTPPSCHGWHLLIRQVVSQVPLIAPCISMASRA